MPALLRYAIVNVATGTILCWAVLGVLVAANFNGWRDMLAASEHPLVFSAMVALSVGPFVGVCYMATGLMLFPPEK